MMVRWVLPFTAAVILCPAVAAQDLIARHCIGCHNDKNKTAGVSLTGLSMEKAGDNADVWEKVLRKVRTGEMPPAPLPKPDAAVTRAFVDKLEETLDKAVAARPNPGRPAIHRLNRAEYSNAIRDLLGLDLNFGATLPPDDAGYGFDNIADVLSISPVLMEKYMSTARRISRLAIGNLAPKPSIEQYTIPRSIRQDTRISDELPFGSRGGAVVRHYFPQDAEYSIRVRVRGDTGREGPAPTLDFRLDGKRIRTVEVRAGQREEDEESRFYEIRTPVPAGAHRVGVTFLREAVKPDGVEPARPQGLAAIDFIQVGGPFHPTGPGDTESRRRIFLCRPEPGQAAEGCAEKIIAALARRAYRRPVNGADTAPLMKLYAMGARDGGGFESGIELALRSILVSPGFLFRVERDVKGQPLHRVSDLELASRLSFFLWSSLPDDELLDLAAGEKLREPAVLEAQVKRMLADGKSKALVENFAGQWLHLRNLDEMRPDPERFKDFDESLREAFRRETELFFQAIVKEDRSVRDFLSAGYTFVNERLAKHYGISGVSGAHFRRVEVDASQRGGVLSQGSVLTVSSYPTRTSPVLRGKWIMENLLGTPPPPPPPNVPGLKDADSGKMGTLREQLEKHRTSPACAACHARMDPLGLALENYDAIGKWRTHDGKDLIDPAGELPGGVKFAGAAALKSLLVEHRDEFVQCLTEKLLTYALGRGLEAYDRPTVRSISREAGRKEDRFSEIILGIVRSVPFQMRRAPSS
jgi:cytochrome c551/c552